MYTRGTSFQLRGISIQLVFACGISFQLVLTLISMAHRLKAHATIELADWWTANRHQRISTTNGRTLRWFNKTDHKRVGQEKRRRQLE